MGDYNTMNIRKHNEFLDIDESENEDTLINQSCFEDAKKGTRKVKRRKINETYDSPDEEEVDSGESKNGNLDTTTDTLKIPPKKNDLNNEQFGSSKALLKKNLVATNAAIKRSGVVYLSRIPPYMKPSKLRSLLEPYGTINRIFLTPEDPTSHARRVRNGGNKKRSFIDGWVEFVKKADAKAACELLNARIIGGKKGTYYRDDIWNLLYLKGFKWSHLTQQIAAENAERANRLRAEISKTTKENKEFVKNVERAKMLEGMKSKKAAKRTNNSKTENLETTVEEIKNIDEPIRSFRQKAVVSKSSEVQTQQIERILRKIF